MKHCNTCPFIKKHKREGSPDWLKDISDAFKESRHYFLNHSCHKTDPKADFYAGKKVKLKRCAGYMQMVENEIHETPGKNGTYNSFKELISSYLIEWLGEEKYFELLSKSNLKPKA